MDDRFELRPHSGSDSDRPMPRAAGRRSAGTVRRGRRHDSSARACHGAPACRGLPAAGRPERLSRCHRHDRLPTPNAGAKLRSMVGAIIYIRVSTKEQTDNLSLPTQLRACEEYCREGFEILERFKEVGESAKTADRTELQRLLRFPAATQSGQMAMRSTFTTEPRTRASRWRPAASHNSLIGWIGTVPRRRDAANR